MRNGAKRGLCCEPYCKNIRRKDRRRCYKCDTRRKRSANPMRHAYRNLKCHAVERAIPFTITFVYFRRWALRTNYLNRTGLNGDCLTVDRKDNLKGYVPGNIQALTRRANTEKQMRRDAIRMRAGMKWKDRYK